MPHICPWSQTRSKSKASMFKWELNQSEIEELVGAGKLMLRCNTTRGFSSVAGSHEEKHPERVMEWPGAKGLKSDVISS
eukprot:2019183-Amphidinium_carterae.1